MSNTHSNWNNASPLWSMVEHANFLGWWGGHREAHIHRMGRVPHSSQWLLEDGMGERLIQRSFGNLLEDLGACRWGNQWWEEIRLGGTLRCS
jgi:hypothetical protein